MAEAVNLTHFDKASLETFLQEHLMPFTKDLEKIQKEDAGIPSMLLVAEGLADGPAVHPGAPLKIGYMGAESAGIVGHTVIVNTRGVAQSISDVMSSHAILFNDINTDLRATMDKYLKSQGDSLDSIDGQKFLDGMKDVDTDLTPKVPAPVVPPPVTKP